MHSYLINYTKQTEGNKGLGTKVKTKLSNSTEEVKDITPKENVV